MLFIGDKLKKLRIDKNLTMEELAEIIGHSQGYISGLESGKKNPQPNVVEKLAEVFNVNPIYFYINSATVKDFFPSGYNSDVIEFVLDANNLEYLRMAIKLKESDVNEDMLNILLTLLIKSREAQANAEKKG